MTEKIRPSSEGRDGLMLNMIERLTRVEAQLEGIDEKIETLIKTSNQIAKEHEMRIQALEAKTNQAEGALRMLKYSIGAIGSVVLALIGYLFSIR